MVAVRYSGGHVSSNGIMKLSTPACFEHETNYYLQRSSNTCYCLWLFIDYVVNGLKTLNWMRQLLVSEIKRIQLPSHDLFYENLNTTQWFVTNLHFSHARQWKQRHSNLITNELWRREDACEPFRNILMNVGQHNATAGVFVTSQYHSLKGHRKQHGRCDVSFQRFLSVLAPQIKSRVNNICNV